MLSYARLEQKENTKSASVSPNILTPFFCRLSVACLTMDRRVVNSNCLGEYQLSRFPGTEKKELV